MKSIGVLTMNKLARRIVDAIVEGLRSYDEVVGIVVYGSIGRGEDDRYSDIDMVIYLKNKDKYSQILDKLYDKIQLVDNNIYMFKIKDKHIFVLINKNIWIELRIHTYYEIVNDIIYIVQSRIKDPSKAVVYDPYGILLPLIKMHWFTLEQPDIYKNEINYLIYSFLYYMKLYIHYAVYRKDSFRAYMNYTIAMYKLAGLIAAAYGEKYNLYGPWYLFEKVVKERTLAERFYKLTIMYANDPRSNLLEILKFLESISKIAYRFGNKYVGDSIKLLIDVINKLIVL